MKLIPKIVAVRFSVFVFALGALLAGGAAQAEQSQDFGDYVVHFNALQTAFLPAKVAKEYGLVRSKQRALLNISVLKRNLGTATTPVSARVSAKAANLNAQVRDVEIREVKEPNAIYYLGTFRITNEETLNFEIHVKVQGESEPFVVKFRQQFFVD